MTSFPLIDLLPRLAGSSQTFPKLAQISVCFPDDTFVFVPSMNWYQTWKPRKAHGLASDKPALQFRELSASTDAHRRCSNWSLSWQTCLTLTSCPRTIHETHIALPDSAFRLAATRFPSHFAAPLPAWGLHSGRTLTSASLRPRVRPPTYRASISVFADSSNISACLQIVSQNRLAPIRRYAGAWPGGGTYADTPIRRSGA